MKKLTVATLFFLVPLFIFLAIQNSIVFSNHSAKKEYHQDSFYAEKKSLPRQSNNSPTASLLPVSPYKINNASDFNVKAKAAIVLDVESNAILYSKNPNKKLPIASLTKIMTAVIVLEKTNLDDIVTVSKDAASIEKGKSNGLKANEKMSVENLLKMMLIASDNAAAVALAEHTSTNVDKFVELMNKKARLLGLQDTNFSNPSGLDQKGNYSTAYDVARLVDYSLEKPLIWDILRTQELTIASVDGKRKHKLRNTNLLLGKMENIVGGKTGFTEKAGQCLALVVSRDSKDNHKIISVVLNAKDRFSETEKLIKWIFDNYKW